MQTDDLKRIGTRLLATTALAALVAATPLSVETNSETGMFALKPSLALAKDGDSDSSGSGSDGDSSDSGSDSDRDRDDDRSGSNSGSDHDDEDDDEDEDEDRSGHRGGGHDDRIRVTLDDGTRVEVEGDDIRVDYSDGWREEIEDGRYRMKDPAGNTVLERSATDDDRTSLENKLPG